jgi:hypothetical protein
LKSVSRKGQTTWIIPALLLLSSIDQAITMAFCFSFCLPFRWHLQSTVPFLFPFSVSHKSGSVPEFAVVEDTSMIAFERRMPLSYDSIIDGLAMGDAIERDLNSGDRGAEVT